VPIGGYKIGVKSFANTENLLSSLSRDTMENNKMNYPTYHHTELTITDDGE